MHSLKQCLLPISALVFTSCHRLFCLRLRISENRATMIEQRRKVSTKRRWKDPSEVSTKTLLPMLHAAGEAYSNILQRNNLCHWHWRKRPRKDAQPGQRWLPSHGSLSVRHTWQLNIQNLQEQAMKMPLTLTNKHKICMDGQITYLPHKVVEEVSKQNEPKWES